MGLGGGFGCRPMTAAPRSWGPASENLQGRKPREKDLSGATCTMGICVPRLMGLGAVLDIRLDGETTFPIIDIFLNRADPILLVTGGSAIALPDQYRHVPRLQKPFEYAQFEYAARSVFAGPSDLQVS
jgi:hypothetical protein